MQLLAHGVEEDGAVVPSAPGSRMEARVRVRMATSRRAAGIRIAAVILASLVPGAASRDAAAIPGVVRYPGNGHWYKLVVSPVPLSWSASRAAAQSMGGHLATIDGAGEDLWVGSVVVAAGNAWIGGTDSATEGTWSWVTGEAWSFTHWAPGQPDDATGDRDALLVREGTGGAWDDVADSDPALPVTQFVVEWTCDPNSAPPYPAAPEAPTDLSVAALPNGTLLLSWTDRSATEDRFEVQRRTDGPLFEPLALADRDAFRYQDFAVAPGVAFTYRLRADNACGLSAWSNEATAVAGGIEPSPMPRAPSGLIARATSPRSVALSWIDQSAEEFGFEVGRRSGDGEWEVLGTVGTDEVAFKDGEALPDAAYRYRVRTVSVSGVSFGVEADARTPPSLDLAVLRGRIRDSGTPGRDSVRARAEFEFVPDASDGLVDPVADGVRIRVGGGAAPFVLDVPPGAPGWRGRGARRTWRSPAGALTRSRVVVDPVRRVVQFSSRGLHFPAPVANPVTISFGIGDDAGGEAAEWSNPRTGAFLLR